MHELPLPALSALHEDLRESEHTPDTIVEHPYSLDEEALGAYALSGQTGLSEFIAGHTIADPAIDAEDILQDTVLSVLCQYRRRPTRQDDNAVLYNRLVAAATLKLNRADDKTARRDEAKTRLEQFARDDATLPLEEQVSALLALADLESVSTILGAALGPRAIHALRTSLFHINNPELAFEVFHRTLELSEKAGRLALCQARETLRDKLGPYLGLGSYARDDQNIKPAVHRSLPKTPKPTMATIRSEVLDAILETRLTRPATVATIPPYLGPLEIIGTDIRKHLEHNQDALALILYPHREKLGDFSQYMSKVIGHTACFAEDTSQATSRLIIDASRTMWNCKTLPPNSYVLAVTETTIPKYIPKYLSKHANFLLHLVTDSAETNADYQAPTYRQAGGSTIQWSEADSKRYIKEWNLLHPQSLDKRTVHNISKKGEGPSTKRVNPKLL